MNFKAIDNIWGALRKKFRPGFSYSRDEEIAQYGQKHDPKANADTTPPEDELINLHCLWAVEYYTPAHMDSLVNSFRKLGWESGHQDFGARDPVDWLNGLTRQFRGGGWMNLGYLIPKESDLFLVGPKHTVPLPTVVKYAKAGIYSITPSLICMVVCLVFEENFSKAFDKALRTDRRTYKTPIPSGERIHFPQFQKTDHISCIRKKMSTIAAEWFSKNLPGLFSSWPSRRRYTDVRVHYSA